MYALLLVWRLGSGDQILPGILSCLVLTSSLLLVFESGSTSYWAFDGVVEVVGMCI